MRIRGIFAALLPVLFSAAPALAADVHLTAAASLKEVINEITDGYAHKHPGVRFVKNYGASGTLAKQIENGAPADIFISANVEWVDYLKNRKLLDSAGTGVFAYNTLVFAGAPGTASSLQDLHELKRIAIGSPRSVPAGEYAMAALKKAGVEKQLENRLIMAKDVRDCLVYAERGDVDGAFVYRTDALQAKKVRILFTVPQELYPRVVYPLALTTAGAKKRDAAAFFAYLHGNDAHAVLRKFGFVSP